MKLIGSLFRIKDECMINQFLRSIPPFCIEPSDRIWVNHRNIRFLAVSYKYHHYIISHQSSSNTSPYSLYIPDITLLIEWCILLIPRMALLPSIPDPTRNWRISRYRTGIITIATIRNHPIGTAIISIRGDFGIASSRLDDARCSIDPMRRLLSITSIMLSCLLLSASARTGFGMWCIRIRWGCWGLDGRASIFHRLICISVVSIVEFLFIIRRWIGRHLWRTFGPIIFSSLRSIVMIFLWFSWAIMRIAVRYT